MRSCPNCKLPIFDGPSGYSGPMCKCYWTQIRQTAPPLTEDRIRQIVREELAGNLAPRLTDAEIFDIADPYGEFRFGDAQGDKRLAFARAIEAKVRVE